MSKETSNQTVYWRKNIFIVPTRAAGNKFIDEISKSMDKTMEKSIDF